MQDLSPLTDEELGTMVDATFFWETSATQEEREYVSKRQQLANEILAERRRTPILSRAKVKVHAGLNQRFVFEILRSAYG